MRDGRVESDEARASYALRLVVGVFREASRRDSVCFVVCFVL
jgi:hypothetical protein